MADSDKAGTPDLARGIPIADIPDGGMRLGHLGGDEIVVSRHGDEVFAVGAHCTHYHGPLVDGLVVGDTVRCPWHHACFSLRSGEALRAPALDSIPCWRVERHGESVFVRERLPEPAPSPSSESAAGFPDSIVIIGGGGAGLAAADMLRREGYRGLLTMLSADEAPPSDRPNLSKDYLAGTAQEDWIPLKPAAFYTERKIDLVLGCRVSSIDAANRLVGTEDGKAYPYGALLIATGAEPVHLAIPGADSARLHYLRTFADSRAIVSKAASARRVLVIGASFIGLEVAASLRARHLEVAVVAPESQPLERVMGPDVGRFIRGLHEAHGVAFHLGQTVRRMDGQTATLADGSTLEADFVVVGVGVRPSIELAERSGLAVDHGITVNEFLETSALGIFAAGDVARWPDPHSGERIRVEHWVVAERQGQVAARNMLGFRDRFRAVPFFWSQHYDISINYVGHAEKWDAIEIDGSLEAHDCTVSYRREGRTVAVATIFRDLVSLRAEVEMERR